MHLGRKKSSISTNLRSSHQPRCTTRDFTRACFCWLVLVLSGNADLLMTLQMNRIQMFGNLMTECGLFEKKILGENRFKRDFNLYYRFFDDSDSLINWVAENSVTLYTASHNYIRSIPLCCKTATFGNSFIFVCL